MKEYSREQPMKVVSDRNGFGVNYDVHETTEEELLQLWQQSGRSEMEGDAPTENFIDEHRWSYRSVSVAMGQWGSDGVINAIIRDKYRQDEMEAITNNMAAINAVFMQTLVTDGIVAATKYLKDSINDENSAKFKEMQEWRRLAKETARGLFPNN